MKIKILAVLTMMVSFATGFAQEPPKYVEGQEYGLPPAKIIQATKDGLGLLVYAERIDQKPGVSSIYPQEPIVILLLGYPGGLVDDETINYCVAKYDGTTSYATVSGAKKTVRVFKFARVGMQ